jgi:hypothetical protein
MPSKTKLTALLPGDPSDDRASESEMRALREMELEAILWALQQKTKKPLDSLILLYIARDAATPLTDATIDDLHLAFPDIPLRKIRRAIGRLLKLNLIKLRPGANRYIAYDLNRGA